MSSSVKINYYDSFRCIAGECPFTCCQEWSISVEEATRQKWEGLKLAGSETEREVTLCNCLKKEDKDYAIELESNKHCPFLNQDKLCRLVTELDENLLSDTCTTYPRQTNTFKDRVEYSLDFGCPVVVDLVYKNEGKIQFYKEGTTDIIPCGLYTIREML
ncbi:MAG: flagellin lysine-N-methylase, partial [Cellulosilyticaceae bacterium]